MARIVWSMKAADDLEEIAQYIAVDKPDPAANLVKQVLDAIDKLEAYPASDASFPSSRASITVS